nr:hypothetical protein [Tanacetum cinerariifolium]
MGVLEVMKISSFMDSLKCSELEKHLSDKAPLTVSEMMRRLDDFILSERAFAQTELPKAGDGTGIRKVEPPYKGRTTKGKRKSKRGGTQHSKIINMIEARGASVEVMFEHCFENLSLTIKAGLKETQTDLVGFVREVTKPLRKIELEACFRSEGLCRRTTMKFTVIRAPSPYNEEVKTEEVKAMAVNRTEEVLVNLAFPDQLVVIGEGFPEACKSQLNMQVPAETFAKDKHGYICMGTDGVPHFSEHCLQQLHNPGVFKGPPMLRANPSDFLCLIADIFTSQKAQLECQYVHRPDMSEAKSFSTKKSDAVEKDVDEWVKASFVRLVKYPTWISNLVLVKKCDGAWRMCINFKNLNLACPKNYYPLPNIRCKVESIMGFKFKCFLDAYKGITISEDDEKKIAFHTDKGTRTMNKAEKNYAPVEKLALSLVHMTKRLRQNFKAHPVKVITDQPIKQILNKMEASWKFVKCVVELEAYNITFEPRNAMKGKVLADFITETPDGESPEWYFRTPEAVLEKDDTEEWTLFIDGASSVKG